jgi:hypothetical protein
MRFIPLFLILTSSLFAQTRDLRLRLMAFDASAIPADVFVSDPAAKEPVDGTEAPVKGYLNHEAVNFRTTGNNLVFSTSKDPEVAKKPESQLATVTLPKSGTQFLLIFLPVAQGKFKILTLDDSISSFHRGAYRIINLSRLPVKLTLEDKAYEFKPGQSELIENPPVRANNHSGMYAYTFVDNKWQRIGAGVWPALGQKRSIQIFFDNPTTQATELRGFRDISPPPVKETAPPTP